MLSLVKIMRQQKHTSRFGLRLEPRVKKIIEQLAEIAGVSASGLIRMMALRRRIEVMEDLKRKGCYNGELEI